MKKKSPPCYICGRQDPTGGVLPHLKVLFHQKMRPVCANCIAYLYRDSLEETAREDRKRAHLRR